MTVEIITANRAKCFDQVVICAGSVTTKVPCGLEPTRLPPSLLSFRSVAIIGSGLQAVDALRALSEINFGGEIGLFSRTGRLPRVQPASGYDFSRFSPFHPGPSQNLSLADFMRIIEEGIAIEGVSCEELHAQLMSDQPTTWSSFREEMGASRTFRTWQQKVFQMSSHFEELWHRLSRDARTGFLTRLRPKWISNLIAMTPDNADHIERMLASGQLTVHPSFVTANRVSDGDHRITLRAGIFPTSYEAVIDATPWGSDGGVRKDLFNGLQGVSWSASDALAVDFSSQQVLDSHLRPLPIFCLGDASVGSNLVPNSIEFNRACADRMELALARSLRSRTLQPTSRKRVTS